MNNKFKIDIKEVIFDRGPRIHSLPSWTFLWHLGLFYNYIDQILAMTTYVPTLIVTIDICIGEGISLL